MCEFQNIFPKLPVKICIFIEQSGVGLKMTRGRSCVTQGGGAGVEVQRE